MNKHTILFLAASPLGSVRLSLEQEARAIHMELERSGHRERFALVTRWAAQPLDLLRELRKLKPTIVHFSGQGSSGEPGSLETHYAWRKHSMQYAGIFDYRYGGPLDNHGPPGLFFQGLDGRPQLVSTEALEETFGAAGASVKLVVLNACYSEMQAEALSAHVDCIVGISGPISDDAARNFAIGFYGGIGERESIAAAYRQGRAAISLQSLPEGKEPQLKIRSGLDAEKVILADLIPEGETAVYNPLRFAAIAIDSRDKNWHRSRHYPDELRRQSREQLSDNAERFFDSILEHWPFKHPAQLHFAKGARDGDPLFDITLVSALDAPVILAAVGVEILRVAPAPFSSAGIPKAAKIIKSDSYSIDMPNIKILYDSNHNYPTDICDVTCMDLPDPIYLEPRAPYRYGLLLRYYAKHMPALARIRLIAVIDGGWCYSNEIEMYQ